MIYIREEKVQENGVKIVYEGCRDPLLDELLKELSDAIGDKS